LKPSWSGCDSVDTENKCLVTMSAAKTVTVALEPSEYELKVGKAGTGAGKVTSSPAGIDCGSTCSTNFNTGTLVTLTGAPETGSQPAVWTGCGSIDFENKCLVTMSSAKAVTATFNLTEWQLTVTKLGTGTGTVMSAPAGIACGATCAAGFTNGTSVTLEGVSGLHTRPVHWAGCTSVIENKCLVTMSSAMAVIATFPLESQYLEHTVTVLKKGTGKGTVTSAPGGIDCGSDCSEIYLHKTVLTLTPNPAAGSVFDHWAGGGCASFTGPCVTSVTSSPRVRAFFVAVGKRTLTVAKAGTGSGTVKSKPAGIECGSTCSAEFDASVKFNTATKVVLKAAPSSGSTFTGWSGACSGTAACKVQMNEARSVTATFAKVSTPLFNGAAVVGHTVKVKGGRAFLKIRCKGSSSCGGSLKLFAKLAGIGKSVAIGGVAFNLDPSSSTTLKVKLSGPAKQALAKGPLKAKVSGTGIAGSAIKLKSPRK
jgi:hypothetical protein